MSKTLKKTLSIIVAILMIVTMLPMAVLPASAASKTKDGFKFDVTYGICKYCGKTHATDNVIIKSISVEDGTVTFQLNVSFKSYSGCDRPLNVSDYSGVSSDYEGFTYTITSSFSCTKSYSKSASYGQNFGEDKPKLIYDISRAKGHKINSWTFNDSKHSGTCKLCGETVNDNCSGGTATCMTKATCSTCGNKYGSLASDNHNWSNKDGVCAYGCGTVCDHAGQTGDACAICGVELHTCDFTGEWKYDTEKHWKECECGEVTESAHVYTDGVCAVCGYECLHTSWTNGICDVCAFECPHEETYETVTKLEHFSVQNPDGTWTKATISVVCRECESVIEYKEADRADYTEFDKAMARVEELLGAGNITEDEYNYYSRVINNFKNNASVMGSPFQETADSYADSLEYMVNEIEAGLADGTMKKADWTYMTALFEEANTLIDNDANNIVPKVIGYYYSPRGFYNSNVNNPNYSQADYNEAIANNDLENMLETLIAGLKDGTMLKADFTAIDEAIAELNEKLADENLTDEAKAGLEEIKAELEKLRRNTYASKADLAVLEKALEEYETELDEGIEDGSAVKVDGLEEIVNINDKLNNELAEKYGEEALAEIAEKVDEKFADKFDELYERAEALSGTVAENKDAIAEIEAEMEAIFAEAENCLNGTHNGLVFEVTEAAACEKNAVESAVCTLCGETVTREVENSALTHSFTEYVYNEDATCTADGTKTAVCDNGCGETDTVTAEDTMLDHADEDGDKICDDCETEIKDVCPDCGEAIHENKIEEYVCMLKTIIKTVIDIIVLLKTITSVFA